jgi:hypothetical protein
MFDSWTGLKPNPETIGLAVCTLCVLLAAVIYAVRKHLRGRPTAEEMERRRRVTLQQQGKMGDGEIVDVEADSGSIVYSYSVAGVIYTATQDLSALKSLLPADVMTMVGPVSVKFDPRNPANSIVLCEEWTGLRTRVFNKGV